jgi:VanZ family protein
MTKWGAFLKFWLPVILWAVLIYSASGDQKSVYRSSRIIEPFVRWLLPNISDAAVGETVFYVRKAAHVTEFAVLAMLLWRALRGTFRRDQQVWSRRRAALAWVGAVGFAMSDELHQKFVPGRQGAWMDVAIDSVGAAAGLALLWLYVRWRQRPAPKNSAPV